MEVGDVVKLKCGSDAMVISCQDKETAPDMMVWWCVWHDNAGCPQACRYPEVCLKEY